MTRFLIVNADDFGRSRGVNRGIVEAHEKGIVTSASVMVRWPAATDAAAYASAHPRLSVGLHVDLGEWTYRSDEGWVALYEVVSESNAELVRDEVERQLEMFRRLVGRDPTHLDSHQHVHRVEPVASILIELARELEVPLRHFTPGIRYSGEFYGQTARGEPLPEAITVDALVATLGSLPPGTTELGCHPGSDGGLESTYVHERAEEVAVLCDPRVRAAIEAEGIELRSFGNLDLEREPLGGG